MPGLLSRQKATPLPFKQILIILGVRFAEPVSFTFLFPFIYFMVLDFNITNDRREIGYYVGLIASSFAVAQFFTGMLWGTLSDRIGRKPVVLVGLFGSAISLLLFGLCRELKYAILARLLSGAINGNVGVLKSMVAEITDKTNRAEAFSYIPMIYVLGTVLGPVLGGFLCNPADKYAFLNIRFLKKYPYFLPCSVCSLLCFCGFIFAFVFLEETFDPENHKKHSDTGNCNLQSPSETTLLMEDNTNNKSNQDSQILGLKKETWYAIFGAGGLSFQGTLHDELLPLWAATSIENNGLSFNSSKIGMVMSLTGIFSFVIQFFFNSYIQNLLGPKKTYKYVCFFSVFLFILYPMVGGLARTKNIALWITLVTLCVLRATSNIFGLTSVNIIMAQTSAPGILGKVNGLDQTVRSVSRAVAPLVCGSFWSWSLSNSLGYPFDYHFVWYFLSLVSMMNMISAMNNNRTSA